MIVTELSRPGCQTHENWRYSVYRGALTWDGSSGGLVLLRICLAFRLDGSCQQFLVDETEGACLSISVVIYGISSRASPTTSTVSHSTCQEAINPILSLVSRETGMTYHFSVVTIPRTWKYLPMRTIGSRGPINSLRASEVRSRHSKARFVPFCPPNESR